MAQCDERVFHRGRAGKYQPNVADELYRTQLVHGPKISSSYFCFEQSECAVLRDDLFNADNPPDLLQADSWNSHSEHDKILQVLSTSFSHSKHVEPNYWGLRLV